MEIETNTSPQSLAGKASAFISRKRVLENYYLNPNCCKQCGNIIKVPDDKKVSGIRKKIFCDSSCSAIFNNIKRGRKEKIIRLEKNCIKCQCCFKPKCSHQIYCSKKCSEYIRNKTRWIRCKFNFLLGFTKKEIFDKHKNWQSARTSIRRHAAYIFNQNNIERKCFECGYDNHVEICHKKSVSDFDDNALITEINDPDNLIGLCPNHHWEFDNGLLEL